MMETKTKNEIDDKYDIEYDATPFSELKWTERVPVGFTIGCFLGILIHILLSLIFKINNPPIKEATIFISITGSIGAIFGVFAIK